MPQLEDAKCSFLFCLGICIFICSIIYLKTTVFDTPQAKSRILTCRPFPQHCPALGHSRNGTRWQSTECHLEGYFMAPVLNCTQMWSDFHFITRTLSKEEEEYPLAFIITIHKELETFVRLLRAIYAPHNVYCIHVDRKAPEDYKKSVRLLAGCFDNVFLATVSERVTYAGFSRLQADINCMSDLVKSSVRWRKVINLCGQDFPIQSNLELVRYMQSKEWRDRNMTPGIKQPKDKRYRTEFQYVEADDSYVVQHKRGHKKSLPPHNLQIYFGTAYYSLTRAFVQFVLESPVAKDFLEWSKDTFSPDEHYWVTLNHIKDAPGSHLNGGWEGDIRAIKWKDQEGTTHNGCKGHYIRDICIYSIEDIPWIINKESMFANKFGIETFPDALHCLEQWHRLKVLQQAAVPIQPSWHLAHEIDTSQCCNNTAGLKSNLLYPS
ncbi:beta-1,3-galactosyl-O-glycosyl-glycoprotein beta-1,6-N-acetylglucosaminyltransferase 7 [Alosa sapidissima]|uniref:beta-1,3-galactosyl-O-glycosyl-glycoprotein beta-1,6-N-acetylglucosaminyltransferase 7 n=1 Tax=Alosa sapidissima TaxID=34773 RepID=UPI001C08550B|nr:beta-1,3-galactosyl-O-glycosyl-glycoprotein beta-1,6-N-acetylglucosaminyltransferase 7 [Alosa sapidissima]